MWGKMVQSGPPTPVGGAAPSLLRQNSGLFSGSQGGSMPSHHPYSSLASPRAQFNDTNNVGLLGNIITSTSMVNASSLLNQSFGNGGYMVGLQQRGSVGGGMDMLSSVDPDSMSFATSPGRINGQQQFQNTAGNQLCSDNQLTQQIDAMQSFQQQFSVPHNQQQHVPRGLGSMGNLGTVKMEPGDQNGQSLWSMGAVKLEPQQPDSLQQQQQQNLLQVPRNSPQAAATAVAVAQLNLLQQQQLMQQQQQQQQILKSLPQQRTQLQQQFQRPQGKTAMYEPGMCARRLTHFMYHQQHRPEDNNIEFWRKLVVEYFSPYAKKRWCVSLYGSGGRQTSGVFPQDAWHCEICNRKPGRGFETTVEVLPRLCQIKYASGTLEELLYVDMPREYQNASGQIVLDYAKAIQESVFEQLRVVREGQLRIVFSPDLKIFSWEFCARRHEELIPRILIIPQVSQLGAVVQKYQAAVQNGSSSLSTQDLQNTCNSFVASARQLAKALEVPLVNDLGYTKRYVRCLQISEVVNCMKDLIDYSRETATGPIDSLVNFPRRNCSSSGLHLQQGQQIEKPQTLNTSSNHNGQSSSHDVGSQLVPMCNGVMSRNNPLNGVPATSATTVSELLHQSSMNSWQETQLSSMTTSYVAGANAVQIPSASSSLLPSQPSTSSPFTSPTPSTSNNKPISISHSTNMNTASPPPIVSTMQQQKQHAGAHAFDFDPTDSQSYMQQILEEIMMTPQSNNIGNLGNDMKLINGNPPSINGGNSLVGNGMAHNPGMGGMAFGSMEGVVPSGNASGSRGGMLHNGRFGHTPRDSSSMNHLQQHGKPADRWTWSC